VAGMITPLISWGLGHINGVFGASTWKYMFLCAGGVTMLWSLIVLVVLPGELSTATNAIRRKYQELTFIVSR